MPLQDPVARFLYTSAGPIDLTGAAAPTVGQVLAANGATSASWQASPGVPGNPLVTSISAVDAPTTSSLTDVAPGATGGTLLTLTPGAGNFLVSASIANSQSSSANSNTFSIYVNGVIVARATRTIRASANSGLMALDICTYVTGVLVGQAIDVRWKVSAGTGTLGARELILMKAQ